MKKSTTKNVTKKQEPDFFALDDKPAKSKQKRGPKPGSKRKAKMGRPKKPIEQHDSTHHLASVHRHSKITDSKDNLLGTMITSDEGVAWLKPSSKVRTYVFVPWNKLAALFDYAVELRK